MYNIIQSLKDDLDFQSRLLERYQKNQSIVPDHKLCCKNRGKHTYYYDQFFLEGKWVQKYIPITHNTYQNQLKIQRFSQEMTKTIKRNISAIKQLLGTYRPCDPDIICNALPKGFFPLPEDTFQSTKPIDTREWAQEQYEQNQKYQGEHLTSSGLYVQSKAEMIIASHLDAYKIPYRYNCPLVLGNHTIHPDFTLLDPVRNIPVYWEHFGMLNDPNYFNSMTKKLRLYHEHNMAIYDRLIITIDSPNGSFNAKTVKNIIQLFFLS